MPAEYVTFRMNENQIRCFSCKNAMECMNFWNVFFIFYEVRKHLLLQSIGVLVITDVSIHRAMFSLSSRIIVSHILQLVFVNKDNCESYFANTVFVLFNPFTIVS